MNKNKYCVVCNHKETHARELCKRCYNIAHYWKKHHLPDADLYNFLIFRKNKIYSNEGRITFNKKDVDLWFVSNTLPDIDLDPPPTHQINSKPKHIFRVVLEKVFDFVTNIR